MLLLIQGCLMTWLFLREGEFNLPYRKQGIRSLALFKRMLVTRKYTNAWLLKSCIYLYLCACVHVCVSIWAFDGAHRGQEKVFNLTELDLQAIVSHPKRMLGFWALQLIGVNLTFKIRVYDRLIYKMLSILHFTNFAIHWDYNMCSHCG